jgi:PKD repeat protein
VGPLFDGPPYSVEFHDLTPAPADGQTIASRYWNFGDGSTSTEKDPVHIYKFPGNYSVLLSVTTICGSQYTAKRAFSVNTYCTQPSHSFTSDVYEGMAPLTVHITDTSTRAPPEVTTWTYTFGALHTSLDRNPVFTYTEPGTYTITQTVTKSCTEPAGPLTQKPSVASVIIKVNPSDGYLHGMPFSTYSSVTTTPTVTAFGERLTGNPTETTPAPGSASPGAMSFSTPPATATTASPQIRPAAGSPEGAPAAAGTGTLSVVTDPAGAAIFLDDVTWGASPASIPNLAAGSHTLRLEKAGYQNMSVPIIVTDGKTAGYSLNLIPENAGTNRAAPLGAAVVIIACAGAGLFLLMRKEHR